MKEKLIEFYVENEKVILIVAFFVLLMLVGKVQESAPEMR